MLSAPPPDEHECAADLRGRLFTDLDRLAFALEMEVAEKVQTGDLDAADRLQNQRLGVRLAQRLVSGVWADEVNSRVRRWRASYERRLRPEAHAEREQEVAAQ